MLQVNCPDCKAPGIVRSVRNRRGYKRREYICQNQGCGKHYVSVAYEKDGQLVEVVVAYRFATINGTGVLEL